MQSSTATRTDQAAAIRSAVVASAEPDRRSAIAAGLRALRWQVTEVSGGAQALSVLEEKPVEILILDDWLPDLKVSEVAELGHALFPAMDQFRIDSGFAETGARSPRRNEILIAVRDLADSHPAEVAEPAPEPGVPLVLDRIVAEADSLEDWGAPAAVVLPEPEEPRRAGPGPRSTVAPLPEIVGESAPMRELAWLVRLVAPRSTSVLIEGATGTGKELVAKAVHQLSSRAAKPFVVLNCAAIPESLLEAELFGHTRGAFTGAVQSRTGRVEAAHGGTLFLDEIGEMPLGLQAKLLRFLECGEIQRIGGNETMRVDVRIIAATHQPLKQRSAENAFRLDLYHRLAVFPVRVPALAERREDIPALARFLLSRFGEDAPIKRLSAAAEELLLAYDWPGNVRELAHVLERATILSEDRAEISEFEIRF